MSGGRTLPPEQLGTEQAQGEETNVAESLLSLNRGVVSSDRGRHAQPRYVPKNVVEFEFEDETDTDEDDGQDREGPPDGAAGGRTSSVAAQRAAGEGGSGNVDGGGAEVRDSAAWHAAGGPAVSGGAAGTAAGLSRCAPQQGAAQPAGLGAPGDVDVLWQFRADEAQKIRGVCLPLKKAHMAGDKAVQWDLLTLLVDRTAGLRDMQGLDTGRWLKAGDNRYGNVPLLVEAQGKVFKGLYLHFYRGVKSDGSGKDMKISLLVPHAAADADPILKDLCSEFKARGPYYSVQALQPHGPDSLGVFCRITIFGPASGAARLKAPAKPSPSAEQKPPPPPLHQQPTRPPQQRPPVPPRPQQKHQQQGQQQPVAEPFPPQQPPGRSSPPWPIPNFGEVASTQQGHGTPAQDNGGLPSTSEQAEEATHRQTPGRSASTPPGQVNPAPVPLDSRKRGATLPPTNAADTPHAGTKRVRTDNPLPTAHVAPVEPQAGPRAGPQASPRAQGFMQGADAPPDLGVPVSELLSGAWELLLPVVAASASPLRTLLLLWHFAAGAPGKHGVQLARWFRAARLSPNDAARRYSIGVLQQGLERSGSAVVDAAMARPASQAADTSLRQWYPLQQLQPMPLPAALAKRLSLGERVPWDELKEDVHEYADSAAEHLVRVGLLSAEGQHMVGICMFAALAFDGMGREEVVAATKAVLDCHAKQDLLGMAWFMLGYVLGCRVSQ